MSICVNCLLSCSVDFYHNWNDYVHGFGNTSGEYWLGLSKLHRLANGSGSTQLRVDMRDKNGNNAYARYSTFYIGGSTTDYTLHVSGYNGTAGDSLTYHNLMKFTTIDTMTMINTVVIVPLYFTGLGGIRAVIMPT